MGLIKHASLNLKRSVNSLFIEIFERVKVMIKSYNTLAPHDKSAQMSWIKHLCQVLYSVFSLLSKIVLPSSNFSAWLPTLYSPISQSSYYRHGF